MGRSGCVPSGTAGRGAGPWRAPLLLAAVWILGACLASGLEGQAARIDVGDDGHVSVSRADVVHVEPTIAASPSDPSRVVIASMIVRRPRSRDFQDSWSVVVYATRDGGRTWHERALPGLSADLVAGDPWLTWTRRGVVYLTCLVTRSFLDGKPTSTWVFRSTDGGWTWSEPERGIFGPGGEVDHPVVTAADGGGRPSAVHVLGTMASGEDEGVRVASLAPGEAEFSPIEPYTVDRRGVNLGGAAALPGGELVLTYFQMRRPPHGLWSVHRSAGGGWEESRVREAILPVGFPSVAVDRSGGPYGGRVYAAWVEGVDPSDQSDLRVVLSHSDDRGRSWSTPVHAHEDARPSRRTLPTVVVNRDGVVGVAWIDARNSPGRSDCTELYVAVSSDGGATFAPEVPVTDTSSCFGTRENGAAARRWRLGGGDYLGLSADADGAFRVAWADSRTGRFQLWTADVRIGTAAPEANRRGPFGPDR